MKRDLEHERVLSVVFNLSPAQSSVLSALTRGSIIPSDDLQKYTETHSAIKVVVSHTRKKLRELGIDIKSRVSVGYWMEPEDKAAVDKMVSEWGV